MTQTDNEQLKAKRKLLKSISFTQVKTLPDTITGQIIGDMSKKDLCRALYLANSALWQGKNEYDKLKKECGKT